MFVWVFYKSLFFIFCWIEFRSIFLRNFRNFRRTVYQASRRHENFSWKKIQLEWILVISKNNFPTSVKVDPVFLNAIESFKYLISLLALIFWMRVSNTKFCWNTVTLTLCGINLCHFLKIFVRSNIPKNNFHIVYGWPIS